MIMSACVPIIMSTSVSIIVCACVSIVMRACMRCMIMSTRLSIVVPTGMPAMIIAHLLLVPTFSMPRHVNHNRIGMYGLLISVRVPVMIGVIVWVPGLVLDRVCLLEPGAVVIVALFIVLIAAVLVGVPVLTALVAFSTVPAVFRAFLISIIIFTPVVTPVVIPPVIIIWLWVWQVPRLSPSITVPLIPTPISSILPPWHYSPSPMIVAGCRVVGRGPGVRPDRGEWFGQLDEIGVGVGVVGARGFRCLDVVGTAAAHVYMDVMGGDGFQYALEYHF